MIKGADEALGAPAILVAISALPMLVIVVFPMFVAGLVLCAVLSGCVWLAGLWRNRRRDA